MPKFDFTFARYGFASIEADTKEEAWEAAKSMPAEAISWSDDCSPTDCNDLEEV